MTEQTAANPEFSAAELVFRNQVDQQIIVIPGVKGDIISAGLRCCSHYIKGAIAVERSHFDSQKIIDLEKLLPEFKRKPSASDAGLQIESDQRHDFGNFAAVGNHIFDGVVLECGKREQGGIVSAGAFKLRLFYSLPGFSADSADFQDLFAGLCIQVCFWVSPTIAKE